MPDWLAWLCVAAATLCLLAAAASTHRARRAERELTAARRAAEVAERERDQVVRLMPAPRERPPDRPPR